MAERKFNALLLHCVQLQSRGVPGDESLAQARALVEAEIARGLEELSVLRGDARTGTRQREAAIDNIARFVCEFYTHHDYHTFQLGAGRPHRAGPAAVSATRRPAR